MHQPEAVCYAPTVADLSLKTFQRTLLIESHAMT